MTTETAGSLALFVVTVLIWVPPRIGSITTMRRRDGSAVRRGVQPGGERQRIGGPIGGGTNGPNASPRPVDAADRRRHHDRVKVTGFEVFPVVCPPPFRGGRSWLFVRLDAGHG